jgi:hypothetical protein
VESIGSRGLGVAREENPRPLFVIFHCGFSPSSHADSSYTELRQMPT